MSNLFKKLIKIVILSFIYQFINISSSLIWFYFLKNLLLTRGLKKMDTLSKDDSVFGLTRVGPKDTLFILPCESDFFFDDLVG